MATPVRRDVPSPRGPGRAILVTVLVVVLLAVASELALRWVAERWLADRMQEALALESRPDIAIGSFPFLMEFVQGEIDELDVTMRDVRVRGLEFDEVTIGLRGVAFDRADLIAGRPGELRVRRGSATVEIDEPTLNDLLRDQGAPVSVELLGPQVRVSSRVEVGGQEATATAVGRVSLEGTTLLFDPEEVNVEGDFGIPPAALALRLDLPPLFPGLTYEDVRVREAVLALRASLDDTVLDLG